MTIEEVLLHLYQELRAFERAADRGDSAFSDPKATARDKRGIPHVMSEAMAVGYMTALRNTIDTIEEADRG